MLICALMLLNAYNIHILATSNLATKKIIYTYYIYIIIILILILTIIIINTLNTINQKYYNEYF